MARAARAARVVDASTSTFDAYVVPPLTSPTGGRDVVDAARRATRDRLGANARAQFECFGISRTIARVDGSKGLRDGSWRATTASATSRAWSREMVKAGATATAAERWDDAEAAFGRALTLDPTSSRAYVGRGACFANQRRYDRALRDFDAALGMDANDARAAAYRRAVEAKMEKIALSRAREASGRESGGARAETLDIDDLRARVLNTGRRSDPSKSYELVEGDDDDGRRTRREKGKSRKRERRDGKRRKERKKRSRRDDSSSSS